MDLGSLSFSVCVIMICLPGAAHCSNGDTNDCSCPEIPMRDLTQRPEPQCRKIGEYFRYKCVDGYTRKAGTSDRIRCKVDGVPVWSDCSLVCIPDPKIAKTKPPKTTVTTPSTSQQTTHSASISASMTAKRETTEPTSSGPVQWSLSDHTQGEMHKVTHESVTSATAQTMSTSTLSLSTVKSSINLIHDHRTGHNSTIAAVISCVSLGIIFAVIVLLYYRRRSINNMMPPKTEEEVTPMNQLSSQDRSI